MSAPATGRLSVAATRASVKSSVCRPSSVIHVGTCKRESSPLASSESLTTDDGVATDRPASVPEADQSEVAAMATAFSSASQIKTTLSVLPSSSPQAVQGGTTEGCVLSVELAQQEEPVLAQSVDPASTSERRRADSTASPLLLSSPTQVPSEYGVTESEPGSTPTPSPAVNSPWSLTSIYDEIVHWSKRFFVIPNNSTGKAFIHELAKLLQAFVDSRGTDAEALYSFMVLPALVLQTPMSKSSYQESSRHILRRLDLWMSKDFEALMEEGQCIQKRCHMKKVRFQGEEDRARQFGNCMSSGRIHQAVRMLSESIDEAPAGVLHLNETITLDDGSTASVREILVEKHPSSSPATESVLMPGDPPNVNDISFEELTAALMQPSCRKSLGNARDQLALLD